jgi:precorrin-2 dehydrogenase/sirohydrochlorin ferrochelatase
MNTYYPVFLQLKKENVLVIGGGEVAERKVRSFLQCKANVQVISPDLTAGLRRLVENEKVRYKKNKFTPSDLNGVRLAVCATNDPAVNRQAAEEAEKKGVLLNVVDAPDLCDFIVPSIVRRGDLTIAVSTGGSSPALARKIRKELQQHFGSEYSKFLKLLKEVRPLVQRGVSSAARRGRIYREITESRAKDLIRDGRLREAREAVKKIITKYSIAYPSRRKK